MKIQRMLVIKVHALLACFLMPLATLYFVSGALYSSDIKGHIEKQVYTLALEKPFSPDVAILSELAGSALDERHLVRPKGAPLVKEKKGSYEYRWGDLKRLVVMKPSDDPMHVELVYRERSPLAQVMRVHRAEAGSLLSNLSTGMAVALVVILASGVYLAVGMPRLRRIALLALGAGFFLVLVPIFV